MEVAVAPAAQASSFSFSKLSYRQSSQQADILVIQASLSSASAASDQGGVGLRDLYKSLSVTAQEVVDKINTALKSSLPNGVQSLKPEEVTPEATADKIVQGATSFFDIFAKQNPDLQGEDLINKFMETIKGGIQTGYDQASQILDDAGAFQFDGVKGGIEKTKGLIEEKLKAWEAHKRKELGLDGGLDASAETAALTKNSILAQAGVAALASSGSLNIAA